MDHSSTVIFMRSDRLGTGDEELGSVLVRAFFKKLAASDRLPSHVLLLNRGILLSTTGSPVLDALRLLEERGVTISSCGTCLDFYGLADDLEVGLVGTMADTVAVLMSADTVIQP